MRASEDYDDKCCNERCKKRKLTYIKGEGRMRCTKCGYCRPYFMEDSLIFLLTYKTLPADNQYIERTQWCLEKVFHDCEWQDTFKALPKPRAAIYWDLTSGTSLAQLDVGSFKLKSGPYFTPDMKLLSELVGPHYEIFSQISTFIKEWAAGISEPEGC